MTTYDNYIVIPNWIIYDMKGECTEMVKSENGKEMVNAFIWLLSERRICKPTLDFSIRYMMDDFNICTSKTINKKKWINVVLSVLNYKHNGQPIITIVKSLPEKVTIDTRIRIQINIENVFTEDEDGNRIDFATLSTQKLEQIFTLYQHDTPIIPICQYALGEIKCYKNLYVESIQYTKGHRAEVFWGSAEELGKCIGISRKVWENHSEFLNKNGIMLNRSYYKGTNRHTTYAFDVENLEQGINYYINDDIIESKIVVDQIDLEPKAVQLDSQDFDFPDENIELQDNIPPTRNRNVGFSSSRPNRTRVDISRF